jgi:hypothetical protein
VVEKALAAEFNVVGQRAWLITTRNTNIITNSQKGKKILVVTS